MKEAIKHLHQWIDDVAEAIENNAHFEIFHFSFLEHDVDLVESILDRLEFPSQKLSDNEHDYSACLFAFDLCIIQLQAAIENGHSSSAGRLQQLMSLIAERLRNTHHDINFWLPLLNAFYEVHIELSDELKNAYVELAGVDNPANIDNNGDYHLQQIRDMIVELSDLPSFDIAQHFFAQSYAMPTDFFYDFIYDLFAIDEGIDIGILFLMHPKPDVRAVIIETISPIIDNLTLSSESLSRLAVLQYWVPKSAQSIFERWIKKQRRQGVTYRHNLHNPKGIKIEASEIDGNGSQLLCINFREEKVRYTCNVVLCQDEGIKDIYWFNDSFEKTADTQDDSFSKDLVMRTVDKKYTQRILNHFLHRTISQGCMPDIKLLQLQEHIGLHCIPEPINPISVIEEFGAVIQPVTPDVISTSLRSSKHWPHKKSFTQAWYVQNGQIDAAVNSCCHFDLGVKICDKKSAKQKILDTIFEKKRKRWLFHFIWNMLWLSAKARKNEKTWLDCFFVSYEIASGKRLADIPIMVAIAEETVENSLETMENRGTYLTQLP